MLMSSKQEMSAIENRLIKQIVTKFKGDALTSFLKIVPEKTQHYKFIESAYEELTPKTKEAFIFTSLLFRYKIPMPSSLLREILGMTWDNFIEQVVARDGKGVSYPTLATVEIKELS